MQFLRFAVVVCVATVAAISNALAVPEAQSVFELLRGTAYDEIYSTFSYDDRRSVTDTTITCVDPQSSENCDADYLGFAGNELNGDGSSVVGSVWLAHSDSVGHYDQAAVWVPAAGGFVLLDDTISPTDDASFATSPFADIYKKWDDIYSFNYGTYATDISTGSQTIVGYALGSTSCGDCSSIPFAFPLIWNPNVAGWDVGELLPYSSLDNDPDTYLPIGWATSISDAVPEGADREYVAGTVGQLFKDYQADNAGLLHDLTAAVWTHSSSDPAWQREDLSNGDFPARYSGAEDVNDLGQVVGWLGRPADNLDYVDLFTFFNERTKPDSDNLQTKAVIWVPGGLDGHQGARLLNNTDTNDNDYTYSNALSIANDGSVVVGWGIQQPTNNALANTGSLPEKGLPSALAWLRGDGSWEDTDGTLINLHTTLGALTTNGGADALTASMANSVDARGRFVAGTGFFGDYSSDSTVTRALYWELDAQGNVIAGGSLEQALQAAGVPMNGKDLTLTEARGVRVVYGTDGKPTDVYLTGIGTGSFGSWIASLSGGLTTPNEIKKSFTPVKHGTDAVSGAIGGIADDQYCRRPTGTSVSDAPWCYFVVGVGDGWVGSNAVGASLAKTFGIAHYFDESTSAGATAGLNFLHGHDEGGSYKALTATVGGYFDHSPETGFQGRASAVLGRILEATFDRVYANGVGTATSTGSTGGTGAGLFGRIGYATSLDDATRTIPFLEVRLATVNLDAFSDTGGPFNATFDATSQTTGAIRIGIDAEHEVNAQILLTGGISATATASTGTGINATVAATPYAVSGSGFGAYVSGNAGVIFQIDPTSSFTGRVDGFAAINGSVGGSALAKYSKLF